MGGKDEANEVAITKTDRLDFQPHCSADRYLSEPPPHRSIHGIARMGFLRLDRSQYPRIEGMRL